MIETQTGVLVAMIGLFAGVLGSIISYIALRSSAKITATPDLVRVYGERLDKLEDKQEDMEKEISSWKRNYFRLRNWLKDFFEKNGIKVVIPEFHKENEKK